MRSVLLAFTALSLTAAPALAQDAAQIAPKPAALVADGLPPVPQALVDRTRPYMEFRTASFQDWDPQTKSMLVSTRFGNVAQLHSVAGPLMARRQISFEAEPIGGTYLPGDGTLVVAKDKGGDEFYQLYTLKDGRLTLITDGKSRNSLSAVSADGKLIGLSSTRRNGTDTDLYVMDPRNPAGAKMVLQVSGGGWSLADFAPGNQAALVPITSRSKRPTCSGST